MSILIIETLMVWHALSLERTVFLPAIYAFIHEWNEHYSPKLVLIYRLWSDERLSWPRHTAASKLSAQDCYETDIAVVSYSQLKPSRLPRRRALFKYDMERVERVNGCSHTVGCTYCAAPRRQAGASWQAPAPMMIISSQSWPLYAAASWDMYVHSGGARSVVLACCVCRRQSTLRYVDCVLGRIECTIPASVCPSVLRVSCANTAERIDVLFGVETSGDSRNVDKWGSPSPRRGEGVRCGLCQLSLVSDAYMVLW